MLIGASLIVLELLKRREMLTDYPVLELVLFPYIWVLGAILIFVGFGRSKEQKHPHGGGVDGAPGFGQKKNSFFGDGPGSGEGGGSGGGGD